MEDINITGADFGSNLPKWATDETLRRLKRVIENDNARDKKDQQKIIGLLGKIVSADKSNTNINKQIITELKSLNKTIASSTNSNKTTTTKQNPTDVAHNKAVEDLLKKANSNLESIKNNVNQQKPTSSSNNSKQTTSDNKDLSRQLEIVRKLVSDNTDKSGDTKKTNDKSDTLGLISAVLGKSNKEVEKLVGVVSSINTSGADKLKRIGKGSLENRVEEATAGNKKDNILKSVENILNKAGGQLGTKSRKVGEQAGKLAGAIGGVSKFALKFAKMVPIVGTVITALSSLSAIIGIVVESGKKYAWDVQKEYRGMLKSGFGFGIETIEKGVKMDGIRIHKMINTAGVAVADGIALMEKNAVLMNNLGVGGVFNTIAQVAEYTNEAGVTFENQLMLSRQEIGEFTTQYLASSMNLLNREKLREENRDKAARKYITDVMHFGQVTGQGMQVIIDRMNTLRQTSDFKLAMASRTTDKGKDRLDTALTLTNSLNLDSSSIDKLNTILMSTRGLGFSEVEGGAEIRNALDKLVSGSGTMFDELLRKVQTGEITPAEYQTQFADIIDYVKSTKVNSDAARQIAIAGNANEKASADFLTSFLNMDANVLRNGPTVSERSSELAAKQAEVENQINLAKTVLEGMAINTADGESARRAMSTTLDLMGSAAEHGADATVSLLSGILQLLTWSMDKLVSAVSKIASWSFFGGDDDEDKRDSFLDKISKSESSVEKSLLFNQISQETGVKVQKTLFGREVLSVDPKSNKALEEHANELIARIENGDNEAVQLYKDMASSKHLYDSQRQIYRKQLEKRMEEDSTAENKIISAFDNHKPTTYKQPVPNEMKPQNTTVAPVAQQVNDAVQAKSDYEERKRIEMEEKRVEEERKRQENLEKVKREESQQNNTNTLAVTPEIATQPVQVANNSGEIVQVSTGINSLNSKLDELIRVQKEFNNNMVIQIIRA